MNTLIQLHSHDLDGASVQTVNARDLHDFLEVGKDFSTWIKDRIEQYGFDEGQDYAVFDSPESGNQTGRGGDRRSKLYAISLSMAKELAMVERNDKGKQARQYFIECERRAQAPRDPMQVLNDPVAMRGLLLTYSEKVLALESTVAEQAPKVDALDRIAAAEGSLCMRDAAKALQVRPSDLKNWLIVNRWIYGRPGHSGWLAYQDRIQQGVLCHKVSTVLREDCTEKIVEQVRITPKGLARIAEQLRKNAA